MICQVGTYTYRSPTLLCHNLLSQMTMCYGFEVDMWSVGCIITELAKGEPLFTALDGTSDPRITARYQVEKILL